MEDLRVAPEQVNPCTCEEDAQGHEQRGGRSGRQQHQA